MENKKRTLNVKLFLRMLLAGVVFAAALFGMLRGAEDKGSGPVMSADAGLGTTQTSEVTETTTSPPPQPVNITIDFAGDILFHANVVSAYKKAGGDYDFTAVFSEITNCLTSDLAVCNMESPVDAYGGNQKLSSYPQFNVPREVPAALYGAGFRVVTTANNHAYDQYFSGLAATRQSIAESGLMFTGTNETPEQYDEYLIVDVDGVKVGFIAYTDSANGLETIIGSETRKFAMRMFNSGDAGCVEEISADILKCREAGAEAVVLSLHWGAEYVDAPTSVQKEIARLLCDSGADIIMGGHSHCVQPVEIYEHGDKSSLIIYSLGNFAADQSALNMSKTQAGMIVTASVTKNSLGQVSVTGARVTPTFAYANKAKAGKSGYLQVLPAKEYAEEISGAKTAYEHVKRIVGDEFVE